MKPRDKFQVISEILQCLPAVQTGIMYKAHLGFYQVKYYLQLLLELELMTCKNKRYFITDKGMQYLLAHEVVEMEMRPLR